MSDNKLTVGHYASHPTDIPAEQSLVGPGSYQGDSTNAEKLLVEKPREWWITYHPGPLTAHHSVRGGPMCTELHVIEKSAYDAIGGALGG